MSSAAEFLPSKRTLETLASAAASRDEREAEFSAFVADLEGVATALNGAAK